MNKEIKKGLVPEFRFSEFKDSGEWAIKNLLELSLNGFSNGVFNDPAKVGSGYKLINVLDMYIDTTINENNLKLLELSTTEFSKNKVEYGDIFFTRSSLVKEGIAYSNVYLGNSEDVTFDGHLIRMRPKKEFNSIFLNYILRTSKVRSQLVMRGKTATMTTIGQADISTVNVHLPNLLEQTKIAACLSSLDDLITAQTQKIAALKTHKKGLMQQLFPQEGETVPKLRFSEFSDSGEWESKELEKVFLFKQGVQVPVEEQSIEKKSDMVRFIRIIDLTQDGEPWRFIQNPGDEYVIKSNELFMIRYGTPGLIAIGYEGVIANNLFRIIPKDKNQFEPNFWFYVFKWLEKTIFSLSCSSSMPAISFSVMNKISVSIPISLKEQQKIAVCLSSLDDLINAHVKKCEGLKTHKKGLMQGLFPSSNEAA